MDLVPELLIPELEREHPAYEWHRIDWHFGDRAWMALGRGLDVHPQCLISRDLDEIRQNLGRAAA